MKIGMRFVIYVSMIISAFFALGVCSLNAASAQNEPSINATNVYETGQTYEI
jgi:hypothetical protein